MAILGGECKLRKRVPSARRSRVGGARLIDIAEGNINGSQFAFKI